MSDGKNRKRRNHHSNSRNHNSDKLSQPSSNKAGIEARLVATTLLTRVVDDQRNLDALCDKQHGIKSYLSLSPLDRSLARAIAVTALRNRNAIELSLSKLWDRPPPKKARFLHHMLHVAAAQILFLEIPDSAAVDLAVSAIGDDERTSRFRSLSNAVLRRMVREKDKLQTRIDTGISPFPKWFEKTIRQDYGKEKAALISRFAATEALVDISVKSNPDEWAQKLGGFVLPTGSVRLTTSKPIETLEGFEEGEWWVQDAAAALPAKLLTAQVGDHILELCAAPGGKTAQLCQRGYEVTALDISAPRLARLSQNLQRLNLSATLVEADILQWTPEQQFDAVLLDAPCSSTGTIRRHPDVLWTRTADEIDQLAQLQFNLIEKASTFVKPGGTLIFSNCSLFKKEGENLIPRLLEKLDYLTLSPIKPDEMPGLEACINGQGAVRTLPYHLTVQPSEVEKNSGLDGIDGFFVCRFTRNSVNSPNP